jgi:hypothetical protein
VSSRLRRRISRSLGDARSRLVDTESLEQTLQRLRADGEISEEQSACLRATLRKQLDGSRYVLGHLGAHFAIGAVFAFDLIPIPLGTIARVCWVAGSRLVESVRGNRERAKVHSAGVLVIAAVPWLGYAAYRSARCPPARRARVEVPSARIPGLFRSVAMDRPIEIRAGTAKRLPRTSNERARGASMRILRWMAGVMGVVVLSVVALVIGARFADGPIVIIPGGPLEAGELVTGAEPDWTFARDIGEMELQLVEPPQSRTIWLQVHDEKLYVVSGYMNSTLGRLWKKWPAQALQDGRAVIRIDGKRYERQLVRILDDRPLLEAIAAEVNRKYGAPLSADMAASGDAWFFALEPRQR